MQVSTIWCHLDQEYALYLRRMAIRVPSEFHEKSGTGSDGCVLPVGGRSVIFLQNIARADMPWKVSEQLCSESFFIDPSSFRVLSFIYKISVK